MITRNRKEIPHGLHEDLAAKFVHHYGNDSLCYLALSGEKLMFYSKDGQGLIPYVVIDRVALSLGDPICSQEQMSSVLLEFQRFCKMNRWKMCFSSTSEHAAQAMTDAGLLMFKYGEEAIIDLRNYELTGKATLKLRNKIRASEKAGLTVFEYYPSKHRDHDLEDKIDHVSAEWFADKKAKLTFSLGDLHLDTPLQRRYFVSIDEVGNVHAVLMFSPFMNRCGYFLDVMRRKKSETVPGVMEHAIITAAMKMKDEGVSLLSLGVVPLAGICDDNGDLTKKIMKFVFKHVKSDYCFESLYHYKKKFAPTEWKTRYVAYEKSIPLYQVWLVMIKARRVKGALQQFAKGVWELLRNMKKMGKQSVPAVLNLELINVLLSSCELI